MPAVVRGGRRQNANGPSGQDPRGGRDGVRAMGQARFSPQAVGLVAVLAIVILGVAVLGTGDRFRVMSTAMATLVDQRLAGLGLRLNHWVIQGASPDAEASIQRRLGFQKGQPFVFMDLALVRDQVMSVGWVKSVKVMRLLPDTLILQVVEREKLAVWQHDNQHQVIDTEGQAIPEANARRYTDLPLVVGDGANLTAAEILPLVEARSRVMSRMEALVRVDGRRWDVRLKDGTLIQLPAQDEEAAMMMLDTLDRRHRILDLGFERIDLRAPDRPAVRRRPGPVSAGLLPVARPVAAAAVGADALSGAR